MHRKYIYVILTLTAICLGIIIIFFLGKPNKEAPPEIQVEQPPFLSYISGVGIIEPKSGNIVIGSYLNRTVEKINVSVNEKVSRGDVLFQLYNDDFLAKLKIKKHEYEKAVENLRKLEALPRKEDLTIAQEILNKAQTALDESKAQYEMVGRLADPRAISKEERDKRLYAYKQAEAELNKAQAQFQTIRSGTWEPDLAIARREIELVQADMDAIELEIERTYIKSPLDGTVLKIDIHEGEILEPGKAAIILGNIDELYVRVSVDQYNVGMFHPEYPAVAFRQGDDTNEFPMKFIRMEPVMVPKKYLTNDVNEKVDTHVFEIIYSIAQNDAPLIVGEQMDVYIDAEKK